MGSPAQATPSTWTALASPAPRKSEGPELGSPRGSRGSRGTGCPLPPSAGPAPSWGPPGLLTRCAGRPTPSCLFGASGSRERRGWVSGEQGKGCRVGGGDGGRGTSGGGDVGGGRSAQELPGSGGRRCSHLVPPSAPPHPRGRWSPGGLSGREPGRALQPRAESGESRVSRYEVASLSPRLGSGCVDGAGAVRMWSGLLDASGCVDALGECE